MDVAGTIGTTVDARDFEREDLAVGLPTVAAETEPERADGGRVLTYQLSGPTLRDCPGLSSGTSGGVVRSRRPLAALDIR
jgi:hypothetical protein